MFFQCKRLFLVVINTVILVVGLTRAQQPLNSTSSDPALARARNYVDQLVTTLMRNYDKSKPSHRPLVLYTYMVIDHLRDFNEYDMTMQLQAIYVLSWQDKRLVWDSKDFGNLTKITFSDYKISRLWLPQIQIKAIMPFKKSIIQPTNTELLLTMNGNIFAATRISSPITCDSQLENYPFDTPNCSLYVISRNIMGYNNNIIFGNNHVITDRNTFFNGNNITQNKDMHVINFTSARYYITSDGVKPQTSEMPFYIESNREDPSKKINTFGTFIHYQIYFRRNIVTYTNSVLLPLYCGTVIMFLAATTKTQRLWLLLMILAIFFEYLTMTRISFSLPPNYLVTPFCMKYSVVIFVETILILIYRITFSHLIQMYRSEPTVCENLTLIQRYFCYFLVIQFVYCTFLLFFF